MTGADGSSVGPSHLRHEGGDHLQLKKAAYEFVEVEIFGQKSEIDRRSEVNMKS